MQGTQCFQVLWQNFIETGDYAASLRQGAATGSATAFSVGIAEKAFIEELLPQVVVTKQ